MSGQVITAESKSPSPRQSRSNQAPLEATHKQTIDDAVVISCLCNACVFRLSLSPLPKSANSPSKWDAGRVACQSCSLHRTLRTATHSACRRLTFLGQGLKLTGACSLQVCPRSHCCCNMSGKRFYTRDKSGKDHHRQHGVQVLPITLPL